jgi:hypothetical protein
MRDRCISQGAALSLFSAKFKPFATKERTIRKLADQSLSIPLSKDRKQRCRQGESRPNYRSIPLRKAQNAETQAIPDPLKDFLGRRRDSTGWQPMPSISSILFFPSTIPRM